MGPRNNNNHYHQPPLSLTLVPPINRFTKAFPIAICIHFIDVDPHKGNPIRATAQQCQWMPVEKWWKSFSSLAKLSNSIWFALMCLPCIVSPNRQFIYFEPTLLPVNLISYRTPHWRICHSRWHINRVRTRFPTVSSRGIARRKGKKRNKPHFATTKLENGKMWFRGADV